MLQFSARPWKMQEPKTGFSTSPSRLEATIKTNVLLQDSTNVFLKNSRQSYAIFPVQLILRITCQLLFSSELRTTLIPGVLILLFWLGSKYWRSAVPRGKTVTLLTASISTGSLLLHLKVRCKRAHLGLPGQVTLLGEGSYAVRKIAPCFMCPRDLIHQKTCISEAGHCSWKEGSF